ncbi:MAG: NAD(P)H-binding protein [Flavobacteriaceae bacterium]|nr:NAD(P)H-binding protein [Flavobacteriaceae bacterium]
MQQKTAIVLGATGLTGRILVKELLNDLRYQTIKVFARKPLGYLHPQLEEFEVDLLELHKYKAFFKADEVYCCIGTTKAKTPIKSQYTAIDFGIPAQAAKLCREQAIPTFVVVSALGANPNSNIFYNRVKGLMESAVQNANIPNTFILRPSLIVGKREEHRKGEEIAIKISSWLWFIWNGPLKKYRPISARRLAYAMFLLPNMNYDPGVYKNQHLLKISKLYGGNRT